MSRNTIIATRILNLAAGLFMFIMNILAVTLPLNGISTAEVSDHFLTLITPAGYAFSIWGVIYFFIALFMLYQLLPATYDSRPINNGVGWLFIANALLNGSWIIVWHYEQIAASVVLMILILLTLATIYYRLARSFVPAQSWAEFVCLHVGFSFYLGWIIAACIVNIYAASTNTDPSYIPAAIGGLVLALAVEGGVAGARLDPIISGVGAWATTAIALKWQTAQPQIYTAAISVGGILWAETAILLLWNIVQLIRGKRVPYTELEK